ncbi:variant erythrocyte surface antigen-1 family protein, partial [Babesia divergens]
MVCYMYYTDVFVGTDNIEKLKKALKAVVPSFNNNSNALTQLVHGLCLFMGYPSCLCSLKANVDKSLQDISRKLIQDSEAVQSCVQNKTLTLNCNSCNSKEILCKCCVISCIKELPGQSQCPCLSNTSTDCQCPSKADEKCCKDFLSGLEACLSLLNLQTDLAVCTCTDQDCCKNGVCIKSCPVCDPDTSTITGLGLSRPNPVRLARKLNEMLCGTRDQTGQSCKCGCGSGSSNTSCCCFCHSDCKTGKFSGECSKACPGCSCSKSGDCPRHTFCKSINSIKVLVGSTEMTCCEGGKNCHCALDSGSKCSGSALNCCVEQATSGKDHFQQSVKCMILRLVRFFKDLGSSKNFFKSCCDLLCVAKTCSFLRDFYNKRNQNECKTCKSGGSSGNCKGSKITPASKECCKGASPCNSNCCLGCQDCDAIKFRNAFNALRLAGPCGQDLWRVLNDFLQCCFRIFRAGQKNIIEDKVKKFQTACSQCKKATQSKTSSPSPCDCCSTGSSVTCEACKALSEDSSLKFLFRHGYSSAYDSSGTLKDISQNCRCKINAPHYKSPCKCKCPNFGSTSHGLICSNPSECCDNCDVRKAAKIFLGFLPCLYYGLKILYDRSKYDSGFTGWNLAKIPEASGLKDFLSAWGFDLNPLRSKYASGLPVILEYLYGSDKIFKKLLDLVSKKYFTSSSSGSQDPLTVRSMLLWLYGLPFTSGFHDLVSHCSSLCLPFGKSFNADALCYYIHTCCFLLPVSVISVIQCPDGSPSFLPSHSDWESFCYPSDPSALLEKFCEYVRKVFVALNFLCIQCKNDRNSAGWNDCAFGQRCAEKFQEISSTSGFTSSSGCSSCKYSGAYLCTAINKDPVHDHCAQEKCRGFGSTSTSCEISKNHPPKPGSSAPVKCTPCPHPLMRFLIDGSSDSDSKSKSQDPQKFRTPFHSSTVTPMGFKDLSSTGKKGWSLYYVLKVFCDDGFYPLTRLVQFILCVSRYPPETLGELFGFFMKFVESSVFRDHFVDWINGEPGRFFGNSLKGAVQGLYGAKDSHKGSGGSSHQDPSKTPADLKSLYDCSTSTCGKYLYPLTYNAYHGFIEDFVDSYVSFVCYLGPKFKKELERFNSEAREKSLKCCLEKSCENIVSCPCALPFLYKSGFTFWSPKSLSCHGSGTHTSGQIDKCTQKSCKNFIEQLEKVIGEGSPLQTLLTVIDNFIWHIRLPFIYAFLYIWIIV